MADWVEVTTTFVEPGNGSTFTGFLIVSALPPSVKLLAGGVLESFRQKYTVTSGQAKQTDGTNLELPYTVDAVPANTRLWFTLVDSNGRQSDIGWAIFPRETGPLALSTYLSTAT